MGRKEITKKEDMVQVLDLDENTCSNKWREGG